MGNLLNYFDKSKEHETLSKSMSQKEHTRIKSSYDRMSPNEKYYDQKYRGDVRFPNSALITNNNSNSSKKITADLNKKNSSTNTLTVVSMFRCDKKNFAPIQTRREESQLPKNLKFMS